MRPLIISGNSFLKVFLVFFIPIFMIAGCSEDTSSKTTGPHPRIFFHTIDNEAVLAVEVASKPEERMKGLMGRTEMDEDSGMIFVWDSPTDTGFWMKDTLLPLSIAFIDADGIIIDIQDMEPETLESHSPPSSYLYAVEVNQGYFEDNGIKAGDKVELLDI